MLGNYYILFYFMSIGMFKLNTFAMFGILFLSSILLGSGIYSSNNFAVFAEQENEAEVKADIKEQENKCAKETECENENKINNQLNLNGTQPQQQQETQTCEECFTTILLEAELNDLIQAIDIDSEGSVASLAELCNFIDQNINELGFKEFISERLFTLGTGVGISEDKINELLDCLEKIYGTEFPRPPFETGINSNVNWTSMH